MPVDERARHALYEAARMAFGDEQADFLRWSFAMWASGVAVVATIAQLAG